MATSKKEAGAQKQPAHGDEQAYEALLEKFSSALELLHKGQFEPAQQAFVRIADSDVDEPVLRERARSYARICERRLEPPAPEPQTPDELYHRAVMLGNSGRHDDALALLERLIEQQPDSLRGLYARASVWALKGDSERAVADLRRSIQLDAKVRFQAVNDPDFEGIREEPAFIDVIEPTAAEA